MSKRKADAVASPSSSSAKKTSSSPSLKSPRKFSSSRPQTKYLIVTGGVVSGLGKGITISSVGVLLRSMGFRVTAIKIDPYLNSDAGTMSPFEHGEVFVLDDGGEADLDLGNYERFLDIKLTKDHNITTGKIYHHVIGRERRGDYLGKTVQVVPHVTNAIQDWIERVAVRPVDGGAEPADICLVEVGGTVGDIESMVFLEALRQFQFRVGKENCCLLHVSLVPRLGASGEQKTKPTQHGVKELRSAGLQPDLIVCRSEELLSKSTQEKIAMFCHVPPNNVIAVHTVSNIYHVPLILFEQKVHEIISANLGMSSDVSMPSPHLLQWKDLAETVDNAKKEVRIAIVGKYTGLTDSYLSIVKACKHAAIAIGAKLVIDWVEASTLEQADSADGDSWKTLKAANGILVPGGFGDRGVQGKILAAKFARESKIPYLGICLGMQVAVIEFAKNVCNLEDANSAEFDSQCKSPIIIFMPEIDATKMGGTMRLGLRKTIFTLPQNTATPTMASTIYGNQDGVDERHRHRYEVNPEYVETLENAGLRFTGVDDRGERMEIIELDQKMHPFFFATQFHPEFMSHPHSPSPPFVAFMKASMP